jgi:hypothetical protein
MVLHKGDNQEMVSHKRDNQEMVSHKGNNQEMVSHKGDNLEMHDRHIDFNWLIICDMIFLVSDEFC